MSPKNYPRQVHFSPTWNPSGTTAAGTGTGTGTGAGAGTGTGTGTTHAATSNPPAPTVTTPVAPVVTTPPPATQATTPITSAPPPAVTSQPPAATVAEVPVAAAPKPNTSTNPISFGTKAGTVASSAPSTTPSIAADADGGSNGTQIAIIGGSVVVAVVILACAAVAWIRRRSAKKRREEEGAEFNRHAAMRQSTLIPDDASASARAPSVAPSQPMIDRHYNTPAAVTYGYNVQPSYQGGPPQPSYQSEYAPGQVLFNAPPSGYATPSGYASGYATPGGAPATTLPSTQYAERAYSGPTGHPGSPMDQYQQDQYPVAQQHEPAPVRRTSAGAYSNMSRGENSTEFQQRQYEDIERSLHGHDDLDGPAPASPSPFGDQAQAPPSPRPGMTQQMPPPVHPAAAAAYPAAPPAAHPAVAADPTQAARAPHGAAPGQRPMSTYEDEDDAYGGI